MVLFESGVSAFEREEDFTAEGAESEEQNRSSVGVLSMQDRKDLKRIFGFLREANSIVADAQPEFARQALQFPYISVTGLGEPMQRREDAHGRVAVESSHIGSGRFRPVDLSHVAYFSCCLKLFGVRPKSESTSSCEMEFPPDRSNQAFESRTFAFSSSLSGSSSIGAFAIARETGSKMASSNTTTALSCVGASRSIS